MHVGRDDQRLQCGPLLQPLCQNPGHRAAGEELILDIDHGFCGGNRTKVQFLHLVDRRLAVERGEGSGDADLYRREVWIDVRRPGIAVSGRRLQGLACGRSPAVPGEFGKRRRRCSVDHHLHVVERPVAHAVGVDAIRVIDGMLRRVPPADRQVQTAAEGHGVVDDNEFLMMAGAQRQLVVEADGDLFRRGPVQGDRRKSLALQCVDDGIVPQQKMNAQLRALRDQFGEEGAEQVGPPVVGLAGKADQSCSAVDVPADDNNRSPSPRQRLPQGAIIGCRIDQDCGPFGLLQPPARYAGLEDWQCHAARISWGWADKPLGHVGKSTLLLAPHCPALRQRDELVIARNRVEAAGLPVGLGLLDAVLRAGHEVPPDMPRALQGGAAQNQQP